MFVDFFYYHGGSNAVQTGIVATETRLFAEH